MSQKEGQEDQGRINQLGWGPPGCVTLLLILASFWVTKDVRAKGTRTRGMWWGGGQTPPPSKIY